VPTIVRLAKELLFSRCIMRNSTVGSGSGRSRLGQGFTLVEILIVVIILGILAAIVIPQFSNASQQTRSNSLLAQLKTLRSQIQYFKIQHHDTFPDLATNQWAQFQQTTNVTGAVDTTAAGIYGPYVNKPPTNPLNGNTTIGTALGAGIGWVYNSTTGALTATNQTSTLAYDETTGVIQ
jgi:general secretion pathway protein G